MKKISSLVIAFLFLGLLPASAAPKTVAATDISRVSAIAEYEGAAVSSQGITIFSNAEKKVLLTSLDFTGKERWKLTLDGLSDQIAMAATTDKDGTIWLAGMSATNIVTETASATTPATTIPTNVDNVVIEQVPSVRKDLNAITVWKVSQAGALLTTQSDTATAPMLITAISHTSTGVTILGDRGAGTLIVNVTPAGKFTTSKAIGTAKSTFTHVFRNSDGSANIYGSSSESLAGKPVAGARDGILAKVNKAGALTNVVRSSANRATRSWVGATPTIFLVGDVRVSGKNETAFTKFNTSFAPTWTLRLASGGAQLATTGANGSHYALFNSTSSISGVTGWRPSGATPIVLRFDSKGVITQALRAPLIKSAHVMSFIPGVGLIIVSPAGIFKG
jgi:hypothetical protein